jgi:hypothetical protein
LPCAPKRPYLGTERKYFFPPKDPWTPTYSSGIQGSVICCLSVVRECVKLFHKMESNHPLKWKSIAHMGFISVRPSANYLKFQYQEYQALLAHSLLTLRLKACFQRTRKYSDGKTSSRLLLFLNPLYYAPS